MKKLLCVLLMTVMAANVIIVSHGNFAYHIPTLQFSQIYENNFDGKTPAEIYAEWGGVVAASRTVVTKDGWLWADWDSSKGAGYYFKQRYINAKYEFDVKTSGIGTHCSFGLRTDGAGNIQSSSSPASGINVFYYNKNSEGNVVISIGDAVSPAWATAAVFPIPYPAGVDFTDSRHMAVYDLDNLIMIYLEGAPFAAIELGDYSGGYYTSGTVYDGSGNVISARVGSAGGVVGNVIGDSFNNIKVRDGSTFAITNRDSQMYMDNFSVSVISDINVPTRTYVEILSVTPTDNPEILSSGTWRGTGSTTYTPLAGGTAIGANYMTSPGSYIQYKPAPRKLKAGTYNVYIVNLRYGNSAASSAYNATMLEVTAGHVQKGDSSVTVTPSAILAPYNVNLYPHNAEVKAFSGIHFNGRGNEYIQITRPSASPSDERIFASAVIWELVEADDDTFVYDVSDLPFNEIYTNDFDGKTPAEIYAEWGGVVAASRTVVTKDGWLWADWDSSKGAGYYFKQRYINAKYEFDAKTSGTGTHCSFGLRTDGAGNIQSSSSPASGINVFYYNKNSEGNVVISIGDAVSPAWATAAVFPIPYPAGVDFTDSRHMAVYDLDNLIMIYLEGVPFAAIELGDYSGGYYTSGTVYDGSGNVISARVGSAGGVVGNVIGDGFNNIKVRNGSTFAITNRDSQMYMDNFSVSIIKTPFNVEEVKEPRASIPMGGSYAEVLEKLPNCVSVSFENGNTENIAVIWDQETQEFDGTTMGQYRVKGSLQSEIYDLSGQDDVYANVTVTAPLPVFTEGKTEVIQFTSSKTTNGNGYIIKTKTGKIIVIDGRDQTESEYLFELLKQLTNSDHPVVEAWFLTHLHNDHTGAFSEILLKKKSNITINNIYFNIPKRATLESTIVEPASRWAFIDVLAPALDYFYGVTGYMDSHEGVQIGDMIVIDDVTIDIMMIPDGKENNVNDTSIVFKVRADGQSILFLGDLNSRGSRLVEMYGDKLKSDMVQMAHHGQGGVDRSVYATIAPELCLWPTPDWLWYNSSGIYQTLVVRGWMESLGVKHHIVTGLSGTVSFTLPYDFALPPSAEYVNQAGERIYGFKKDKVYLSAVKQWDKEYYLVSALYNGDKVESVKSIPDSALDGNPILLFDLTDKSIDDFTDYSVKTFVWEAGLSLKPAAAPYEIKGGAEINFEFDDINAVIRYSDNFDGKTASQIYTDWGGCHLSLVPNPVTPDGWLRAYWDTNAGVGYYLKQSFMNARYSFDVKRSAAGGGLHAFVSLRTNEMAGSMYNSFQLSPPEPGRGIGIFLYKSESPGAAVVIADADSEVLSTLPVYDIPYPAGIDFTAPVHMDIYDLDNKIVALVNGAPYISIVLSDLRVDGYYHSGCVYNGDGVLVGSFTNRKVPCASNFAIAERGMEIYIDNFSVAVN